MSAIQMVFIGGTVALLIGGALAIEMGNKPRVDTSRVLANQESVLKQFDQATGYKEPRGN